MEPKESTSIHCDFCDWAYSGYRPESVYARHWVEYHAPRMVGPLLKSFLAGTTAYDRNLLRANKISAEGLDSQDSQDGTR